MSRDAMTTQTEVGALQPQSAACGPAQLWALIPVKALPQAKQRLKDCLGKEREAFTLAMFEDVLAAVEQSRSVRRAVVVTADAHVARLAGQRGIMVVEERGSLGMNAAIGLAVAEIRAQGDRPLVILPADVPLLTGAELDRLAAAYFEHGGGSGHEAIGLSPSARRDGTNCLFLYTDRPFDFSYGQDSYALHRSRAAAQQRLVVSIDSPAVSLDIDQPRDIAEFLAFCARHPRFEATATWKFLASLKRPGQVALNLEP
jgi:2-phospho-L-lactate guanylyltransferase